SLPLRLIATWFGCGLFPVAPGTAGSLGGLIPAVALLYLTNAPCWVLLLPAALLTWPGIRAADAVALAEGRKDPQIVVVDEVLGQWITLAGATRFSWESVLGAF